MPPIPTIPPGWGRDDDPETRDDSLGAEGGSYPAEVLDPPDVEGDAEDGGQ